MTSKYQVLDPEIAHHQRSSLQEDTIRGQLSVRVERRPVDASWGIQWLQRGLNNMHISVTACLNISHDPDLLEQTGNIMSLTRVV